MNVIQTQLDGVIMIEPDVFGDSRGYFLETYQTEKYRVAGITDTFVQDNHSFSRRGILRGLHAQYRRPQAKLVRALEGEVFDVVVAIRPDSPTLGHWFGTRLSGDNFRQLYIPPGYAHGFCVLSDTVHFEYKCSDLYDPDGQLTVQWNDPMIGIEWPIKQPTLSSHDQVGMSLTETLAFLDND